MNLGVSLNVVFRSLRESEIFPYIVNPSGYYINWKDGRIWQMMD